MNLEGIFSVLANCYPLIRMISSCPLFRGTQRPNVSQQVPQMQVFLVRRMLEAALIGRYLFVWMSQGNLSGEVFGAIFVALETVS